MCLPKSRSFRLLVLVAIVVATCAGLPLLIRALLAHDQFSDQYATVGEYFNPLTLIAVCGGSDHYIRVGGKTYTWHDGVTPGYFIVPQMNAMIFETRHRNVDGQRVVHVRDLSTGVVAELDVHHAYPMLIEQASCGACPARWWVHNQSGSVFTFGLYNAWPATQIGDQNIEGGAILEFSTIDFAQRRVTEVRRYEYNGQGSLVDSRGKPIATPPGTTAAELIGEHWAQAGLPSGPAK